MVKGGPPGANLCVIEGTGASGGDIFETMKQRGQTRWQGSCQPFGIDSVTLRPLFT